MGKVYISDEHLKMLDELSKKWGKSYAKVVEFLVEDRYSVSNPSANAKRRDKTLSEFLLTHSFENTRISTAWRMGYNKGWMHFQTRHGENEFILEEE
jgi:hypothetical protein